MNRMKSKRIKRKWAALWASAFLLSGLAGCKSSKNPPSADHGNLLRVAIVDSQNEFTSYEEETNIYTGIEPDLIRQIASGLQLEMEYVKAESGRETEKIDLGEAMMAIGCIPRSSSLEKQYAVSIPYGTGRLYVVTRRGNFSDSSGDFLEKETGISGKLRETALLSLGGAGNHSQRYTSLEQVAEDLKAGKITGYFCYEKEALDLCKVKGLQAQSLVNTEPEKYVLVMAHGQQELMGRINVLINEYLDKNQ